METERLGEEVGRMLLKLWFETTMVEEPNWLWWLDWLRGNKN